LNILAHVSDNGILPIVGKRSYEKNNKNLSVDVFVHQLLTFISQAENQKPLNGGKNQFSIYTF
jgi:hypothetical protein